MGLMDYISNNAETNEKHINRNLRTRYYKTSYLKLKNIIIDYANKKDYIVSNIDEQRREILIQTTKFHLIITLLQVNSLETSVNIKVQIYKLFGLNRPKRVIENLYTFLSNKEQLKGIGLHP